MIVENHNTVPLNVFTTRSHYFEHISSGFNKWGVNRETVLDSAKFDFIYTLQIIFKTNNEKKLKFLNEHFKTLVKLYRFKRKRFIDSISRY